MIDRLHRRPQPQRQGSELASYQRTPMDKCHDAIALSRDDWSACADLYDLNLRNAHLRGNYSGTSSGGYLNHRRRPITDCNSPPNFLASQKRSWIDSVRPVSRNLWQVP